MSLLDDFMTGFIKDGFDATVKRLGGVTVIDSDVRESVNVGTHCQESYPTGSADIRKRARQLRAAGYAVTVAQLGRQATDAGTLKLSQLDIRPGSQKDTWSLPELS